VGQVLPLMAAASAAATTISASSVTNDTPRPVMKTTGIGTQGIGGY